VGWDGETNLERSRSTVYISVVLSFFSCSRSNVFGIGEESCCGLDEGEGKGEVEGTGQLRFVSFRFV